MVGYSSCSNTKNVSRIILEKYGLNYNYEQEITLFNPSDIFWPQKVKQNNSLFSSSLNTLDSLFKYIRFNEHEDLVTLPNGIECNVSTLFDYMCISFLHTHNLLVKNNINIFDVHSSNIFIKWLDTDSWLGNTNIKDIEFINYKINGKIYKIETYGFIIKIGDLGMGIVKPREDVYIIGQGFDLPSNHESYKLLTQPNISAFDFIGWNSQLLPERTYRKTVSFNLVNEHPYDKIIHMFRTRGANYRIDIVSELKTAQELLNYFSKYEIPEIIESHNILVIEEH